MFIFGGDTGISRDLSDTVAIGAEIGLRFQPGLSPAPILQGTGLESINHTGGRWALPGFECLPRDDVDQRGREGGVGDRPAKLRARPVLNTIVALLASIRESVRPTLPKTANEELSA